MESNRGIDAQWMIQMIAAIKHQAALCMLSDFRTSETIDAMVKALDSAGTIITPKPPQKMPISYRIDYTLKNTWGQPIIYLLRGVKDKLHWQQNPNYENNPQTADFVKKYAYCEFIGQNGYVKSDKVAAGVLLMGARAFYPTHAHPAAELYYVLSGQGRFQSGTKPWKNCPAGLTVVHQPHEPHKMETKDLSMLALYIWQGDVNVAASLTEDAIE